MVSGELEFIRDKRGYMALVELYDLLRDFEAATCFLLQDGVDDGDPLGFGDVAVGRKGQLVSEDPESCEAT